MNFDKTELIYAQNLEPKPQETNNISLKIQIQKKIANALMHIVYGSEQFVPAVTGLVDAGETYGAKFL